MANKTFRRVLSIIMCAAMLVSVFSASFQVSAADDTVVYDWNFTDTANGATYLADLQSKSTVSANTLKSATSYEDGYLKVVKTNDYGAYIFNTPEDFTLGTLTITAPNNDDTTTNYGSAAGIGTAVVGKVGNDYISIGAYAAYNPNGGTSIVVKLFGGYSGVYRTNDQGWGDQSLSYVPQSLLGTNIPRESYENITYKWTVKPSGDSAATAECEVTYVDDNGTYTGKIGTLKFDATNIQKRNGANNYTDATSFVPVFGIRGKPLNANIPAKFYSVKAVYTKAGEAHEHTAADEREGVKAATCTEPGYTGDVFCAECGEVMEKGEETPALDHNYEWVVTKSATETETGLEEHKCTRCGDVDDSKEIPVLEKAVAVIGDARYTTLADAIAAATAGQTVTLLADVTEDVVISKNITLDLDGNTITNTNAGKATVSVTSGAGVTVKNGTVTGGDSYYNIEVVKDSNAKLTLEDVTATAGNTDSSMIDNWGTLTVNSGTYTGGLNVVKNEPAAVLNISGGTFTLEKGTKAGFTAVVYNYGELNISGGTFVQGDKAAPYGQAQVVLTDKDGDYTPSTIITSGTFKNLCSTSAAWCVREKIGVSGVTKVSGGTFNKKVNESYCADGFIPTKNADGTYGVKEGKYVAKVSGTGYETIGEAVKAAKAGDTITLLDDIVNTDYTVKNVIDISLKKGATLDGNGHTISGNVKVTAASAGGITIKKVIFKDIHNDAVVSDAYKNKYGFSDEKAGTLSAVYAPSIAGKLTITDCTFENADWEALQITPVEGADLVIKNNIFKTSESETVKEQLRFIHIEMAYGDVDHEGENITATVTDNQMLTDTKDANMGVWWVGKGSTLDLTGNYYNNPDNVSITLSDTSFDRENRNDLVYPARSQAEVNTDDLTKSAIVIKDFYNSASYNTFEEAAAAATSGQTIKLLADCSSGRINLEDKDITVDLNGHTLTSTADYGVMFCAKNGHKIKVIGTTEGSKLVGTLMITANTDGHIEIDGGTYENAKYCPIYVNGAVSSEDSTVTVKNAAITYLEGDSDQDMGVGVYLAGYSTALFENSTITAPVTGLEIRAGKLTLNNCDITGGNGEVVTKANGNGSTVTNAAVAISQHATKKPIEVNINGGTFTATAALYQTDVQGTGSNDVIANVSAGTFNGTVSAETEKTVAVSGGTFSAQVPENCCAEGFAPVANDDGTYGVKAVDYVAETNDVKYESLQAAVDAAKSGATVKLLSDTRENVSITKKLTLDLNGFTINGGTEKGKAALYITARVTVKDSSEAGTGTIKREDTAENSGISSYYVMDIQGDGWVIFEGGNVTNNSGIVGVKGASLVRIGDDSKAKYPGLTIKGGTFTQDNFIAIKVDRGDLFLNGGTVNSANSYAIENWHRATINSGTINGAVASWTYSGGANSTLNIKGGTVNGDVTSVNYGNAEDKVARVYITGGTVTGELDTRSYDPKANELTSIDDAAKANIEVTGGTFANDPAKYVTEAAKVNKNEDGTFGVEKVVLATVGGTDYYTMDEAFKAQTTSGATIIMQRDYKTNSTFNSGSINRTVDLNGHTWTYTGTDVNSAAFEINYSDVTLTVKNGSVISNSMVGLIPSAMNGTITYDNAGLVFDGVIMTANGHSGIETNGNNTNDTVKLIDSTLNVPNGYGIYFPSSGKLNITSSRIVAKTMGVQVCAGSLRIGDGSIIEVTGSAVPKTEGDGAIEDGNAISIVDRAGYKGLESISVIGGIFKAANGSAIEAYGWKDNAETEFVSDKNIINVEGGRFSSEVPAEYCKDGYKSVKNASGTYSVKPIAFRVVLESDPENAGILTGGGNYAEGETAVITASAVGGYTFLGWYDKDGNVLTTDTTYTVPAGKKGEVTYTAKYVGNENKKLTVNVGQGTVTAEYGSEKEEWKAPQNRREFCIGTKFTVTAKANTGFEFLYWVNKDNRIITDKATLEFILGDDSEYAAIYREVAPNTPYVIIRDSLSAEILSSGYAYGNSYVVPKIYDIGNNRFIGWYDEDGNEFEPNEKGELTITKSVTIYARYDEDKTEYTVTTVIGDEQKVDMVQFGKSYTVEAADQKDDKYFSGWFVNGECVSTKTIYSFIVTNDITIVAKYTEESVITEPIVNITVGDRVISDGSNGVYAKVVLTVNWDVPEGYTFAGAGLLRTYDANFQKSLTLEAAKENTAIIKTETRDIDKASGTYMLTVSMREATSKKDLYTCGYVTYTDATGKVITQYTKVIKSDAVQ